MSWNKNYSAYITTAIQEGPKQLLSALDKCRSLSNLSQESIIESMPEDWTAVFYNHEPNLHQFFSALENKNLCVPVDSSWGLQTHVLGLIPLTHFLGEYLQKLGSKINELNTPYLVKLYTMTVEYGITEEDQLRFYGSLLVPFGENITTILENYEIAPITRQDIQDVVITRNGPTKFFYSNIESLLDLL